MKKRDFIGWKYAFSFAFEQGRKQKAFSVFLIIGCLVALLLKPAISMISAMSADESDKKSEVSMLTVYDESGLGIDYETALNGVRYTDTELVMGDVSAYDGHVDKLKALSEKEKTDDEEKNMEMIVRITYEEGYFNMIFVKAAASGLDGDDCKQLAEDFEEFFSEKKLKAIDVTEEQMAFIGQPVSYEVVKTTAAGELIQEEENESISMEEYGALFGTIMVVVLIVSFCGSTIATSIVTEKSTRVIEYLMINIRPMALILGKILSSVCITAIQLGSIMICYLLSGVIDNAMFGEKVAQAGEMDMVGGTLSAIGNVSPLVLVICLVLILGAIMFFSILAGISGATVSKIDELAEGLKTYNLIMIVGAYTAMFFVIMMLQGSMSETVISIFSILPVFSAFMAPGNLLIGKISIGVGLISLVVMLLSILLMFKFAAGVFEALIFHNGRVLKMKDIMGMAKSKKTNRSKEVK